MSDLAEIVRDMGELFRTHVAQQNEKIRALETRVLDLEGHAEHGPAETCGFCAPDDAPETVGADEYGTGDVAISDFTGECEECDDKIKPGDEIVALGWGTDAQMRWRHRECAG